MELLYLNDPPSGELIPLFNPQAEGDELLTLNPMAIDEGDDLKILAMTWNMGASEDKDLLENLDNLFKDRLKGMFNINEGKVDMIIYTSQECKMGLKKERIDTLEAYFN